jgi:hypothetical protein
MAVVNRKPSVNAKLIAWLMQAEKIEIPQK